MQGGIKHSPSHTTPSNPSPYDPSMGCLCMCMCACAYGVGVCMCVSMCVCACRVCICVCMCVYGGVWVCMYWYIEILWDVFIVNKK